MVFDWDDFGCNHIISDQCQSHDCRDALDKLHYANLNFKATLFAIPGEMTGELMAWCKANEAWIELAVHGYYHTSNYECEKWTYQDAEDHLGAVDTSVFVKGFKAPGWQISDETYKWLKDNGWWVADQSYNDDRRPLDLPAYLNKNGQFMAYHIVGYSEDERDGGPLWGGEDVEAWHGHTWNCVGNGIYETFEHVKSLVEKAESFQFVSEVL